MPNQHNGKKKSFMLAEAWDGEWQVIGCWCLTCQRYFLFRVVNTRSKIPMFRSATP